jgi:dipeptidyl aminopeptidase/acylaminoacyl peptidase
MHSGLGAPVTTKTSFTTLILLILGLLTACQVPTEPVANTQFVPSTETLTPTSTEPRDTLAPETPTSIPATPTPTLPAMTPPVGSLDGVVAFYSDRDGNPEIYVMNLNDSSLARLTDDPASDDSPAISPDGTQVVFLTARHDLEPHFPNYKYEIYVMDIDGGNPRRLTYTEAAEDHPAWSPDGSKILFDADYDEDGFFEIYFMNSDGTDVTRLTSNAANDQFADWSPGNL